MHDIPIIETERLILRGHRAEDFPASAAMWGDLEVTRLISGRAFTPEECWGRVLRYVGHWALMGFGYWVLTRKSDGAFVGESGFANYRRPIESPHAKLPEIGWVLAPAHHRQGYGLEAVDAITRWGDRFFKGGKTMCLIAPENAPSIRLAERAGYRIVEHNTYLDQPTLILLR
jgi:RimJ/RimL family protein N-acetyltransferase